MSIQCSPDLGLDPSIGPFMMDDAGRAAVAPPRAAGELVIEYIALADALARRFWCPGHDAEDLRQVARLGLVKAAQRYRAGMGHGFVAFAMPTVAGELKRYLRDQSWTVRPPRRIQELRLKVNAARPRLAQELGHDPSTVEIGRELGLSAEDVAHAQIADFSMVTEAIEPTDWQRHETEEPPGTVAAVEEGGFEQVETFCCLASALRGASDQDLELIRLRFGQELTQEEIAQRLGVSQMQVSRLLRRLLARLRRRMGE